MLTYEVVCIKIGLDSYDDFFKQVLDLMVNINVNPQWSIVVDEFFTSETRLLQFLITDCEYCEEH